MNEQVHLYETHLNTSLIKRITEENRFAALNRLPEFMWNLSEEMYNATFDRHKI